MTHKPSTVKYVLVPVIRPLYVYRPIHFICFFYKVALYVIATLPCLVLIIRENRIDEAAGRGDSDSRMTSFEVIMPLKVEECKWHVLIRTLSYFSKWKR